VNLGLKIELDADEEGSISEFSIVVDRSLEEVALIHLSVKLHHQPRMECSRRGLATGPLGLPERPGIGKWVGK
jgi:hypothetical protein